jgi:hypothetical protein
MSKGNCEHCERILPVDWYQLAAGVPDWHLCWWTAVFPNPTALLCEECAEKFEAERVEQPSGDEAFWRKVDREMERTHDC